MLLAKPECNAHVALEEKKYDTPYAFSVEMNRDLGDYLFQSVRQFYVDEQGNYDTTKKDFFQNTLFHWLAFCNQVVILQSFPNRLENENNSSGQTPAHLAAICGHLDIIKMYLSRGLDVNTPYDYSATLLHTAARHGHKELVSYLVTYPGIDLNPRNGHYSTPLREACDKGFEEIVSILLEAGADVNLSNLHQMTPLITAAEKGYARILEILLAYPQINVKSKVINGCTALDYARQNGHEDCVTLLRSHEKCNSCILS